METEWNVCPSNWPLNFRCTIRDSGDWRHKTDDGKIISEYSKFVFLIKPIGTKTAPTLGDQRNFFTGLLECEWMNDNVVFNVPHRKGESRPPQKEKKIEIFKEFIDKVEKRMESKIPRGIDFYINQWHQN